ncbi:MAG TPA: hypothetical protein VF341_02350 [Anaeromyxobacteraceae bacterium]
MSPSFHNAGLTPRTPAPPWLGQLESVGLAMLLLAAGAVMDRRDPFLLHQGFPWLALAPLLAGLRHGTMGGLLAGGALDLALALAWRAGHQLPAPALGAAIGWMVTGLLAGQFSDQWRRRGRELEAAAGELRLQLEALSLDHHALELSHERLRRQVPGIPSTLRGELAAVGQALRDHPGPDALSALGASILRLFAEHAFVQSGSLHPVAAAGRPGPAVARLGAGDCHDGDPLLRAACDSGEVASVRQLGDGSELLAAVPLVDVEGHVHAVVAIRDMPFASLHDGTLTLLAVIGGTLGLAIPPPRPEREGHGGRPEPAFTVPAAAGGQLERALNAEDAS